MTTGFDLLLHVHSMRLYRLLLPGFACLTMVACGTTKVDLRYVAPSNAVAAGAGAANLKVGSFEDQRGESSRWLGAIRGGFGNPIKNLEASATVSEIVARAFADGIGARGFSRAGGSGSYEISGVVRKLECNQVIQREAIAEVEVSIANVGAGRRIFTKTYSATKLQSSGLSSGVFGSPEELRLLTEQTLQEVVDKALDDPALRNALRT